MFLILYADDIVIFAESKTELQTSLDLLLKYCNRWKLIVNVYKTKMMSFRKCGQLSRDTQFFYNGNIVEIVRKFTYLGVVFSISGSFTEAQNTLSGQALKASFKMNTHLFKFTSISVSHRIELFDKLILPILNYASEVWGEVIERMHLQFMKKLLELNVQRRTILYTES